MLPSQLRKLRNNAEQNRESRGQLSVVAFAKRRIRCSLFKNSVFHSPMNIFFLQNDMQQIKRPFRRRFSHNSFYHSNVYDRHLGIKLLLNPNPSFLFTLFRGPRWKIYRLIYTAVADVLAERKKVLVSKREQKIERFVSTVTCQQWRTKMKKLCVLVIVIKKNEAFSYCSPLYIYQVIQDQNNGLRLKN